MLLFGVLVGRFCFLNVDSKTKLEFDSKAKLSLFKCEVVINKHNKLGLSCAKLRASLGLLVLN